MKDGLLHRFLILILVMGLCRSSRLIAADDVDIEAEINELLAEVDQPSRAAAAHIHDDEDGHEHGEHVHFRVLPDQLHRAPPSRAPLPPSPPGNHILDPSGEIKKLVLLLRFKGHENRKLPLKETYEIVFNRPGGHPEYAKSGSAYDYSREVSYRKMSITTHLVDWIDLPETEQYYANGNSGDMTRIAEGIRYALDYVDQNELVDFRDFDRNGDGYADLFSVLHSGFGAEFGNSDVDGNPHEERIWSHQYRISFWTSRKSHVRVSDYSMSAGLRGLSGAEPCRIGLLAHEVAHLGGLPDLYDSSNQGTGIGSWGLLGFSEGFEKDGHTPSHFSPWAKIQLKWLKPKELTASGYYRLQPIETKEDVYKIQQGFPENEYLLIENRQPVGFDRHLPGGKGGLAIWHIDENKSTNREPGHPDVPGWPGNGAHYKVALLQADGRFDLERGSNYGDEEDLFRAGGVNRVSSLEPHGLRPYRIDARVRKVLHRISEISESDGLITFRYDVEESDDSNLGADQVAKADSGAEAHSTEQPVATSQSDSLSATASSSGSMIPIAGAVLASAEFSHAKGRRIHGNGVLLETTIHLLHESDVHVRGSASVMSEVDGGKLSTGISNDRSTSPVMWQSSVRLASVPLAKTYSSLNVNCRRRLPRGSHVIRWVVRSKNELRFDGGGSLIFEAFPRES
ncbi:MAG: M6 family metalloprotease domain-containing protein [Planctomycetota bacterium]|nr:M6 family metalloprotease domain-containing protein [Planctomycetota bacterium]